MIRKLALANFRCFKSHSFDFGKATVISGPNRSGKTSLVEAVGLLSCGLAIRGGRNHEFVSLGAEAAEIGGSFSQRGVIKRAALRIQRAGERVIQVRLLDGAHVGREALLGLAPTVSFVPEELERLAWASRARRRLLDLVLLQSSPGYGKLLASYARSLTSRNDLLEKIARGLMGRELLAPFTEELIELGSEIQKRREKIAHRLAKDASAIFRDHFGSSLTVRYHPSGGDDLRRALEGAVRRDIETAQTSFGPHRDDLHFEVARSAALSSARHLPELGSRSEWRAAILVVKLASLHCLAELGETILLLDDPLSEFDEPTARRLAIVRPPHQLFVTTTREEELRPLLPDATPIRLQ